MSDTLNSLKILVKRTETGAIQEWTIFYGTDSVGGAFYYTVSGQANGKKITNDKTYCLGKNAGKKNETSDAQQAEAEARAKWDKKLKSGYFTDIKDIDNETYVEPMLAKEFKKRGDKVVYPVGVQTKFNGHRCIATTKGLFTRKGERYVAVPHIEKSLIEFFKENPDAVLDGELFNEDYRLKLNELSKLIRPTTNATEELLTASKNTVRYYVYDGYNIDCTTKEDDYVFRAAAIKKALKNNPYYVEVETVICNNEAEINKVYEPLIEQGHEGVIVRILGVPYENKRTWSLLKHKPEDDSEGKIIKIINGKGNWANFAAKATIQWNGKEFDATFKGTEEQKEEILKNQSKWIGKEVTFLYNGLTGLGIPNYARIDVNNCFKA